MEQTLHIKSEDHQPLAIVHLSGWLAQLEVYKLKSFSETLLEGGTKYVVLDLTEMAHIDSAGIGVVVQLSRSCAKAGGHLNLVRPSQAQVQRVLEVTSLEQAIAFRDDIESALSEMQEKFGVRVNRRRSGSGGDLDQIAKSVKDLLTRIDNLEKRVRRLENG